MDALSERPFYIYISKFSLKVVRLPKHMVIAETTKPPTVINVTYNKPRRGSWLGTPKKHEQIREIPDENATSAVLIKTEITAIHNKPTENRGSQMTRHQDVLNGYSKRLSEDWPSEVQVMENYALYQEEFLSMLSDF